MNTNKKTFVLSLGGSLVVPNGGIDIRFLKTFNNFIRNQISSKKRRFFITVGGGSTTRHYQKSASMVRGKKIVNSDLDWIGVHATRLNAQLIRTIFIDIADPRIIKHYDIILKIKKPIAVAAGWKPGWSTDYCAIMLCQDYGIRQVINLTNIDRIYDKDPKKYDDVKPIEKLKWKEYRKMIGNKWIPGMNVPFDPIASKLAEKMGITVKILNGKNIDNLSLALDSDQFHGTIIS